MEYVAGALNHKDTGKGKKKVGNHQNTSMFSGKFSRADTGTWRLTKGGLKKESGFLFEMLKVGVGVGGAVGSHLL